MADSPNDPASVVAWLKKLSESATRIKLAPGVIGKSSYINLGTIVLWGIVLFRLSATELIFDGLLFVGAGLATWWGQRQNRLMRDFAVANPHLALMEGADIVEYKRFEAQAKGYLGGTNLTPITDPRPHSPPTPDGSDEDA